MKVVDHTFFWKLNSITINKENKSNSQNLYKIFCFIALFFLFGQNTIEPSLKHFLCFQWRFPY